MFEMMNVQNGQPQAEGPIAQTLLSNSMNPNKMRPFINDKGQPCVTQMVNGKPKAVPVQNAGTPVTNAVLRKDEWKQIDEAMMKVRRERLTGIDDLVSRGLTYNLTNPMASTVMEFERVSDSGKAQMDMDGINRGQSDRPKYEIDYLPIPIIHSDFHFNSRVLESSRTKGDPLDTTQAENSTRRVDETLEDLLFTNTSYTFGAGTIYSYVNHPNRLTKTLSQSWSASGKTGEEIVQDVIDLKQQMIDNYFFGPFVLYISAKDETVLDEDYVSGYPKTIRQRILEISGIDDVKVADHLAQDNLVMVQMTSDVIRLVDGMSPTSVQWESQGGFQLNFKILTIRVPQIRQDYNGRTGIVHASL